MTKGYSRGAEWLLSVPENGVARSAVPPNMIDVNAECIRPDMLTLIDLDQETIEQIVRGVPGGARNVQDIYPLSPLQEGVLFQHLLDQRQDTYVLATLFEFNSRENLWGFIGGLQSAIARHDALRTAVIWENLPRPVQVVYRQAELPLERVVLNPNGEAIEQLKELMRPERLGLSLHKAPLLRLQIAEGVVGGRWYGLLQRHHIVFDHQSWNILFAEIIASVQGREHQLQRPRSYRDYVAGSLVDGDKHAAQVFFRGKLGDVEEPTAPFGLLDLCEDSDHIHEASARLSAPIAQKIRSMAQSHGVSPARLFHAAWALVVARTSGREDVVFGTVLSGARSSEDQAQLPIGLFVNTLPFRVKLQDVTVKGLVDQTNRELTDLLTYRHISPAIAQSCSAIAGATPLVTAVLNYRHSKGHSVVDARDNLSGAGIAVVIQRYRTSYPIMLVVDDFGDDFGLTAQTDRRLEPGRIIEYVRAAMQALVAALKSDPTSPVQGISVIPEWEYCQITQSFNATRISHPCERLVQELFDEQVHRTPNAIAVTYENQTLTYSELSRRATWLAWYLRDRGVGPDQLVGIHLDRGPQMIVGLLGVLKAGGAYVPLDPHYPAERLHYMISDANPRVLLTEESLWATVPKGRADLIVLDALMRNLPAEVETEVSDDPMGPRPHNLLYVIYTSGTTGRPKGIAMPHGPIVNLLEWHRVTLGPSEGKRVLQFAALSFDVASQEIFSTLCSGGNLVLLDEWVRRDAQALTEVMVRHSIQRLFVPPLMLQSLAECNQEAEGALMCLEDVITAGEQLRISPEISRFFERLKGCLLHNHYGPTEAHVITALTLASDAREWAPLPTIGGPISNTQIYVLDARLQITPLFAIGEIYIGGIALSRGYLGRPELTAQRFVADPYGSESGARLYRTGDLGRWRADGTLEYLGRNDDQVKIRGHRIELREIEAQLTRHEDVKDAIVVAREDVPGEKRLVAYFTGDDQARPSIDDLRSRLKEALPSYMMPSAFVALERFPLTPSGKLDRRSLPMPAITADQAQKYEAPQGETERSLAELWMELLQLKRVDRQDNFFDIGGHSLLALKALLRVNQTFGSDLRVVDLYKNPTLRELALRIRGGAIKDDFIDLATEAALSLEIAIKPSPAYLPPKVILLTGVTGFVGRFLLRQLLQDTDASIYCLVRARSQHQAQSRLRASLQRWDLWHDEFSSRLVAIAGDLRLPRLGIDDLTYNELSQSIESIYHCATSMNHLETYEMAKVANVGSAKEIVKLAARAKQKSINYISTLGIFSSSTSEPGRVVNEESAIDGEKHRTSRGYVGSKWVAEKIFMTAGERGIPCNIFRLGLVWGDTQQGRYDELQREYRILKSCLLSGLGIRDYQYDNAPVPVDRAAQAVVFLANRHANGTRVFHICSSARMLDGLFERCNQIAGTSLQLISYYEWINEIKRLHQQGQSLPVVPLIEFAFGMDEGSLDAHLRQVRGADLRVACERTHRELEHGGIQLLALNDGLLKLSIESMLMRDPDLRELAAARRNPLYTKREGGAFVCE